MSHDTPTPDDRICEADLERIVQFYDREMSAADAEAFRRRLEQQPSLREEAEAYAALHEFEQLVRSPHASSPTIDGGRNGPTWQTIVAAAAAAVAVWFGIRAIQAPPAPVDFDISVLPTGALLDEHADHLGLPKSIVNLATRLRAGGAGDPDLNPEDLHERIRLAEEQATDDAFADAASAARAGRFYLPLRVRAECSGVIVQILPNGAAERIFPRRDSPADRARRFVPGETYLLPDRGVHLAEAGPDIGESFVVPRGIAEVRLVAAFRAEAHDAAVEAELQRMLEQLASESAVERVVQKVDSWLSSRGFQTRVLRIRAPS